MRLELAPVAIFQEKTVPDATRLAGWAALTHSLSVSAPVRSPSCVSERFVSGSRRGEGEWIVFDKRYWPGDGFADHLTFALRHEPLDLLVLKRVSSRRFRKATWRRSSGRHPPVFRPAAPGFCTKP
jgi:hypothetical protein